ncbi:MAG: type II toxin-antitoxin system RelE family toxin [Candidatus Binatia bacterium]
MRRYRVVVPPGVAKTIRALHPTLRRRIRAALDAIAEDPMRSVPLRDELAGLRRVRVQRHRIAFAIDPSARTVHVLYVGPRTTIYQELGSMRRRG